MKRRGYGSLILYSVLILSVIWLATNMLSKSDTGKPTYSDIKQLFYEEKIESFTVKGNGVLTYVLKGETAKHDYRLYSVNLFVNDLGEKIDEQFQSGNIKSYDFIAPTEIPWWVNMLPYVFLILLVGVVVFFTMNQMRNGGMGGAGGKSGVGFVRARVKLASDQKKKVLFSDVAGCDEEKEELTEVVDFLSNPRRYVDIGARIPKGVLLVGPPGTGKTLLAKAVAGEANAPFLSISGSDFLELYVGVGASRVRDLFDQAKKLAPSIIFIDEIDAVARQRGAGLGGGHDEREQTLNQLLVEMDGFAVNEGVIVIAATNRPDILDPAITRAGRFDRQVVVSLPDIRGREEILKVHSRGKSFADSVNFETIEKVTVGFSGAELENVLNEAAIVAVRRNKAKIEMADIEDSITKIIVGVEKKTKKVNQLERKLTAYHEAGHAIVTHYLPTQDDVHEISIIPRGMAGGYTLSLPKDDKSYISKTEMFEDIVTLLGGRVAEKLKLGEISSGASNDIERASAIARRMVTKYGMSDKIGPIVFGTSHDEVFLGRDFTTQKNCSEQTSALIDEEIKSFIDQAYTKAQELLQLHTDKLDIVAQTLLQKEKITGDDFAALLGEPLKNSELTDTDVPASPQDQH